MMRAEAVARVLFLMIDWGLCLYIWRILFHHQHSTIIHTILMGSSKSNLESENVKSKIVEYKYDGKGTLTISGSGEIPKSVLKEVSSLKVGTLVIQGEVESIGEDVFRGFSFLTKVEINSPIQSIGDNAFCGCDRLRSIKIPASVTSMGTSVFYGCDHLEEIESESLRYPAEDGVLFKVTDDGKRILVRYPSDREGEEYSIPNDVVEIEEYAFAKCRNLKSIRIPETVRKIGCGVFDACRETFYSNLETITVSRNLETIIVSWLCPPKEIDRDIFGRITEPSEIRLIVPEGSKSDYEKDPVWKNCEVIEEGDKDICLETP